VSSGTTPGTVAATLDLICHGCFKTVRSRRVCHVDAPAKPSFLLER
jgi:hypothetical protein